MASVMGVYSSSSVSLHSSLDLSSRRNPIPSQVARRQNPSRIRIHATTVPSTTTTTPPGVRIQREIPGSYGLPLLGSVQDRLSYFWFQGLPSFFTTRMEKHRSTVFRVNMPPGSPFFPDPRVIMLLDQRSFSVLFDVSKVSKRDVFTGTYKPSPDFTGGYRILSYLDVDEPRHAQLKGFCFDMLKSGAPRLLPELHAACSHFFSVWEKEIETKISSPELNSTLDLLMLRFLTKSFLEHDATLPEGLSSDGPKTINTWIGPQIAPILNPVLGLPAPLEELLFHTFPLPFALVRSSYQKIVDYFSTHGEKLLEVAESRHGVPRDEALHNLIFLICFNTFGGLTRLIPAALLFLQQGDFQEEIRREVRAAVSEAGGTLGFKAMEKMPLLQSFVYEVLRMNPPVAFQYGRAREDMVVESHREAFVVRKGEMLCGFQPIAARDPVVFERAGEFVAGRFLGEEGERLLRHLVWSNGPETVSPSVENKQCAGKDFIVMVTRFFLAEFLVRYDSFQVNKPVQKGAEKIYTFKSLVRSPSS